MKVKQICFQKIGPFENTRLDFTQGHPGLHVVYGANEAGKSSALRYFNYFFFGIPLKNDENFKHEHQDFLIQAVLQASQGDFNLTRTKKKGREVLLPDGSNGKEILDNLLGPVREEEFHRLFGISHSQIRHGAQDLLDGQGDLVKALFEAGSGLHDIGRIQETLDEQIEAAFSKRTNSEKPINATIEKYKNLRTELEKAKLDNSEWRSASDSNMALKSQVEELEKEITGAREKQERLQKIIRVLPNLTKRKLNRIKLAPLEHIPLLQESEITEYEQASKKRETALVSIDGLKKQTNEFDGRIKSLVVDENILFQRNEIEALYQALGQMDSLLADLPKRMREKESAESEAKKIALELYKHDDLNQIISLLPNSALRTEISGIHADIDHLEKQILEKREEEAEILETIQSLERKLKELDLHPHLEQIQALFETIKAENLLPSTLKSSQQSINNSRGSLDAKFQTLSPWQGSQEKLLETLLPTPERLQYFRSQFQVLESKRNILIQQSQSKQQVRREKQSQVENTQPILKLPTMDALKEVRQTRDMAWKAFQDGTQPPREVLGKPLESSDARLVFLTLVEKADDLADRIMADGERIGTIKQLTMDIQRLDDDIQAHAKDAEEIQMDQNKLEESWKSLWMDAGIHSPGAPPEMLNWLEKAEEWKKEYQIYQPIWLKHQEYEKKQGELFGQVAQLLALKDAKVDTVWQFLNSFITNELAKGRDKPGVLEQFDKEKGKHASTKIKLNQLVADKAKKDQQWVNRLGELKIPTDAGSDRVQKYLSEIETIKSYCKTASEKKSQAEKIHKDINSAQNRLKSLLKALNYEKYSSEPDSFRTTVEKLAGELEQAKKDRDLSQEFAKQLQESKTELTKAEKEAGQYEGKLNYLAKLLGTISLEEVSKHFENLRIKAMATKELEDAEIELTKDASGENLDDFCRRMEGQDDDRARLDLELLDKRIVELGKIESNLREEIGGKKKELETLEKKHGAFEFAAEMEGQKSLCQERAREFAKAVLAKLVLNEAARIYREENENPILAGAKTYFEILTLGNYTNIVPTDADGRPVLQVIRKDGTELDFSEKHLSPRDGKNTMLSDGTADQLFLSLRLAAIENHLSQIKDPLPIILDDILIQYDDERSIAALECLAKLSEKTQVIMFTHHKHLGNLIERCRQRDKIFFQEMKQ